MEAKFIFRPVTNRYAVYSDGVFLGEVKRESKGRWGALRSSYVHSGFKKFDRRHDAAEELLKNPR